MSARRPRSFPCQMDRSVSHLTVPDLQHDRVHQHDGIRTLPGDIRNGSGRAGDGLRRGVAEQYPRGWLAITWQEDRKTLSSRAGRPFAGGAFQCTGVCGARSPSGTATWINLRAATDGRAVTAAYEGAGLVSAEIQGLTALAAAVEAGDPLAPWVAVRRTDVLHVVRALDKLVDRFAASEDTSSRGPGSSRAGKETRRGRAAGSLSSDSTGMT